MIDFRKEKLFAFSKTAAEFRGGGVHVSTLHRYRLRGVGGVRLEAVKLGGRWYTSLEAIDRFVTATNASSDTERGPQLQNRSSNFDDANRQLDSEWGSK